MPQWIVGGWGWFGLRPPRAFRGGGKRCGNRGGQGYLKYPKDILNTPADDLTPRSTRWCASGRGVQMSRKEILEWCAPVARFEGKCNSARTPPAGGGGGRPERTIQSGNGEGLASGWRRGRARVISVVGNSQMQGSSIALGEGACNQGTPHSICHARKEGSSGTGRARAWITPAGPAEKQHYFCEERRRT